MVTNPPFRDEGSNLCPGDSGLRVCTYPHGKLRDGMPHSDRVASGLAYPLVAGLVFDGNHRDAIAVCAAIRSRQSGTGKSPWNEPERGLYSARSMAGWNVFDQACGFVYDSTKAAIAFRPKIAKAATTKSRTTETFSCFCTFHQGFGEFRQTSGDPHLSSGTVSFEVLFGSAQLKTMHLATNAHVVVALLDGNTQKASIDPDGRITFDTTITIGQGSVLTLKLSSPCSSGRSTGLLLEKKKNEEGSKTKRKTKPVPFALDSSWLFPAKGRKTTIRILLLMSLLVAFVLFISILYGVRIPHLPRVWLSPAARRP